MTDVEELAPGLQVERDPETGQFVASHLDPGRAAEIGRLGGKTVVREARQAARQLIDALQLLVDDPENEQAQREAKRLWLAELAALLTSGRGSAARAAELLAPFVGELVSARYRTPARGERCPTCRATVGEEPVRVVISTDALKSLEAILARP